MALRRKEKRSERSKIDATPPWERRKPTEIDATTGPYDLADAPQDDVVRVDLGALRVPAGEVEMRVDVDENQQIVGVTLSNDTGQLQLGAFAAPRSEGLWSEVRGEIAESVVGQGGSADEDEDGSFGTDLVGHLGVETGNVAVRFLGVDGPRWFLRGLLIGAPAQDADAREPFLDVLRNTVVVRGTDPLPVRDPIPLRLPAEIAEQVAAAAAEQTQAVVEAD